MFAVVIHCADVPDPSVTALHFSVWERISPLCILNDGIMKFVCCCKAGVFGECVFVGVQCVICVTITQFCKQCILSAEGTMVPSGQDCDAHADSPQLEAMLELLKDKFTQRLKLVIIHSAPYQGKVFVVHKTALKHFPKQLK